jgi:rSAM/selenodomain-associated transferase 1
MPVELLIVFVKAPRAGQVKTRLAGEIGTEAACAAYRRLVEELIQGLHPVANVELRFTPDSARTEIQPWLTKAWTAVPQGMGDLGARLERAFDEAFAAGARRVVVIGSDCPEVMASDITAAWRALRSSDAVIGPATDGGYWLIGLRAPQRTLFRGMSWSTDGVLAETSKRAAVAGLAVHRLRELGDVDTAADWRRFLATARE